MVYFVHISVSRRRYVPSPSSVLLPLTPLVPTETLCVGSPFTGKEVGLSGHHPPSLRVGDRETDDVSRE